MNDPIVDEVRRIRGEHAAQFNYDLWAIFKDIKDQQERSGLNFVSFTNLPDQVLQQTGKVVSDSETTEVAEMKPLN